MGVVEEEGVEEVEVSVLLPVHNALPWLADAVGCVLAQRDVRLELIAVDDRSTDGSREWLLACAAALEQRRAAPAQCSSEPCCYDTVVEEALAGRVPWQAEACVPRSPAEVAALACPTCSLRVLSVSPAGCSGQGLALNTALSVACGLLVGEHEADDLRPPHAFALMRDALAKHPHWDGVTSRVVLGGSQQEGMQRWVDWQNTVGVGGPAEMAFSRFIEIPAMRAAGLYRRRALASLGARPYRDLWPSSPGGAVVDLAAPEGCEGAQQPGWWPVDSDFFGAWFDGGLTLGKLPAALYVWRQYPQQSTRTHSRCALERLRACKAHFLVQPAGGPAAAAAAMGGTAHLELWACGSTLDDWTRDLRAAGARVCPVRWRPGDPAPLLPPQQGCCAVRLWAFGMEKARQRVRASAPGGFEEGGRDWFIA